MSLHRIAERTPETEEILSQRTAKPELGLTSLASLNDMIWGIKRRNITLIAARTSMGKTALALQVAWDLAQQGKKVLFFSLEMSIEQLTERLFCLDEGINNRNLQRGMFKTYEVHWKRFVQKLHNTPKFVLSDICGKTWEEVDQILNEVIDKPDVIFIDHINHIKTSGSKNDKEAIDNYLKNIHALAIRHNVAIVVVAQINRTSQDAKDPEPQLHQLKGTGVLEEIAGCAILLHWKYYYDKSVSKSEYTIIVAKNREGQTGYVKVDFEPECYRFKNAEVKQEDVKVVKKKEQQIDFKHKQAHDLED